MAEPNKPADDKPKSENKPEAPAPTVKPLTADVEKDLRAQVARLQHDLALKESECKALSELLAEQEKARAEAKAKKAAGPKVPIAKVRILGEGRRWIEVGAQLRASEAASLVEGVHFDMGALDG